MGVPLLKRRSRTCWQRKRAQPKKRKRKTNRKGSPRKSRTQKRKSRPPVKTMWVALPEVACEQGEAPEFSTHCILFGAVAGVSVVVAASRACLRYQGSQGLYVSWIGN